MGNVKKSKNYPVLISKRFVCASEITYNDTQLATIAQNIRLEKLHLNYRVGGCVGAHTHQSPVD